MSFLTWRISKARIILLPIVHVKSVLSAMSSKFLSKLYLWGYKSKRAISSMEDYNCEDVSLEHRKWSSSDLGQCLGGWTHSSALRRDWRYDDACSSLITAKIKCSTARLYGYKSGGAIPFMADQNCDGMFLHRGNGFPALVVHRPVPNMEHWRRG